MPLAAGARLGPYEILGLLGAGGMGEVYRARDTRLGRDVALKVIPEELAAHKDRLRRFEQEARATAALSHPNILALFDVGAEGDVHYVVEELLEGETLRERVRHARLPVHEAVECGVQIARGLAAAHERGIVHRDLKPENVFLTRDGRVKLLDFGLAKLTEKEQAGSEEATATAGTDAGTRLGTVGYMSPEQARGDVADAQSDIFSLGVVLYELLAGRRAFSGPSAVETLNAILTEDPPELSGVGTTIPVALDRVIRRCLEKRPEVRFQSAHDVALALEAASAPGSGLVAVPAKRRPWLTWTLSGGLMAVAIGVLASAVAVGRWLERKPIPSYHQLTFGRGTVRSARFAPDGQTIVYSAAWDGDPLRLYLKHPSSLYSLPLELPSANLLGISPSGEMAIAVDCRSHHAGLCRGTLARAALTGGSPRDVAEGIQDGDWSRDGQSLLVVRDVAGKSRIEFPMGKILYETTGHVSYARLSPQGDRIAFLDHPFQVDDAGTVAVIDLEGRKTTLSRWAGEQGLAWTPSGDEIWFTAAKTGANRSLYAVSLEGKLRLVARVPGSLKLHDIAPDGRVLLTRESRRTGILGVMQGDERERNLSYLGITFAADLSPDARMLLFDEEGEAGGANYTVLLRKSDRSPVVRLGDGGALALSPDGKWALSMMPVPQSPLILLPTGTGDHRELSTGAVSAQQAATWFPDSRRILFAGSEPGHGLRLYVLGIEGGAPRPFGPEGISSALPGFAVSPDGRLVAAIGPDQKAMLIPVDGGETRTIEGVAEGEYPVRFSADGRSIFVWKREDVPARISRVDVVTGRRHVWKELMPADPAGIVRTVNALVTPDGKGYAYCYDRLLSDLFLVEGLR
jgi:Tol biopolymer transport system component